jgi:eukaryotic-like serine/threonine-protein kinase
VVFEHTAGRQSTRYAKAAYARAELELAQGQLDAAAEHAAEALSIFEHALGPAHPHVAAAELMLANVDLGRGIPSAALERVHRAEAIFRSTLGADHPDLAIIDNSRGDAFLRLGRFEDALAAFDRALERVDARHPVYPHASQNRILAARRLDPDASRG